MQRVRSTTRLVVAAMALAAIAPTFASAATYRPNLWGYATSGYQIEGGWDTDGRGPTIWDNFVHTNSSQISGGATADVAADHYDRYADDLAILKQIGSTAYRFSIQWPRIIPNGTGSVNQAGIDFYSNLIDAIIAAGSVPVATMFHWDLPQPLQDSYGGIVGDQFPSDFETYAKVIIDAFGSRVKYWLSFNEPASFCKNGYLAGAWPPMIADTTYASMYLCGHNYILAHIKAAQYLHSKYPDSLIGFALNTNWWEPAVSGDDDDETAADNVLTGTLGWFTDPFFKGDYPDVMKNDDIIGPILPSFTKNELSLLTSSCDFVGFNYYTAEYATYDSSAPFKATTSPLAPNGTAIGELSGTDWLYVYPSGIRKLGNWIYNRFGEDVPIWITENGVSVPDEPSMTAAEVKDDTFRQNYFTEHLAQLDLLINTDKVPIQLYLAWSLLDNFEWKSGYNERFGVVGVDYTNNTLDRNIKDSCGLINDFFTSRTAVNESSIPNSNSINSGTAVNGNGSKKSNAVSSNPNSLAIAVGAVACFLAYALA